MKKNITIGLLVMLVIALVWFSLSSSPTTTATSKFHHPISVNASGDVTCTYPQTVSVDYSDDNITHELPKAETNPIIMTFGELNEEVAKIKFIDATQTISEVPVIKLTDTDEKVVLIEGTGDPYVTVHTIYKKYGVSTYSKQISFFGTVMGTMGMGVCGDS